MNVTVTSGANRGTVTVSDGTTVAEVRERFADAFEINERATALLNGKLADAYQAVFDGDQLSFTKTSGEKG